jgi:hypothetical protein
VAQVNPEEHLMWRFNRRGTVGLRLLLAAGLLICGRTAQAVIINPGEWKALEGPDAPAGTVIHDDIVDFWIDNDDGTHYAAKLQVRVARLDSTGKLEFSWRIRDPERGSSGEIYFMYASGYTDLITNVDYVRDNQSDGTEQPDQGYRTNDGEYVGFWWDKDPIGPTEESVFYYVQPAGVDCFRDGGTAWLYTNKGGYTTVPIVVPGAGGVVAEITEPDDLTCVCPGQIAIRGTVDADGGNFYVATLEYRPARSDSWTLADWRFSEVHDGVIFYWDTSGLSGGWYTVRVAAYDLCGNQAEDTRFVYLDDIAPTIDSQSPGGGAVVGGTVCVEGFVYDQYYCGAEYVVEYAPEGGKYQNIPLAPAWPATLTTWDTAGLADGNYLLRIRASDPCGNESSHTRKLVLDNTVPIAVITAPENCDAVEGVVEVRGTANDAHLAGWTLQYTGGAANGWVTIASGNTPVINGLLANWNTDDLLPCCYTLRLIVSDSTLVNCVTNWWTEYLVSVDVGGEDVVDRGDINCDGSVDFDDIDGFIECLINGGCEPCP